MSIPLLFFFLQETHCRPGKSFKIANYVVIKNNYINSNVTRAINGTVKCIKKYRYIY